MDGVNNRHALYAIVSKLPDHFRQTRKRERRTHRTPGPFCSLLCQSKIIN